VLKLTTDKHEASRGLSATAELLVALHYITAKFIGRNVWTESSKVQDYCNSHCRKRTASMPRHPIIRWFVTYGTSDPAGELTELIQVPLLWNCGVDRRSPDFLQLWPSMVEARARNVPIGPCLSRVVDFCTLSHSWCRVISSEIRCTI